MKRLAILVAAFAGIGTVPAALPAQQYALAGEARAAGQVGERFDGYLGLPGPVAEPVRRQVGAINLKRRALYSDLAARRGVSPQEVGITAACTLFARIAVGEAYLLPDNVWRRRAPGQGVPRPDYCG